MRLFYFRTQFYTEFYHRLEQQVFFCTILLDVVLKQVTLLPLSYKPSVLRFGEIPSHANIFARKADVQGV